jgi:hypothetical protein
MVPVRGGRAAPPVKATISVNPATGTSAPVWTAAAIGDTAVQDAEKNHPHKDQVQRLIPINLGHNKAYNFTRNNVLKMPLVKEFDF